MLVLLTIGLLVATIQVVVSPVRLGEGMRIYLLAALAALFGGSLVKAILAEGAEVVSLRSGVIATAVAAVILLGWHQVSTRWSATPNPKLPPSANPGLQPSTNPGLPPSANPGLPPSTSQGLSRTTNPGLPPSTNQGFPPSDNPGLPASRRAS